MDAVTPTWSHSVQMYREVGELADGVAAYLGDGLEAGEPALAVVRPEHWAPVALRLSERGLDPAELERAGMLVLADAEETLAEIMDGSVVSGRRFERVVGRLLDSVRAPEGAGPVRVFGEMVDILARRGDRAGAAALEELWNRVGPRRRISLLCGYELDLFDRTTQVSLVPQVCNSHSHVLPAADQARLEAAVDEALEEALGFDAHKVRALVAPQAHRGQVPLPQLMLMWVSANMPALAERVLASARTRYLTAAG